LAIWYMTRKIERTQLQEKGLKILLAMVFVQFILGVLTLIYAVPLWLGIAHQIGAFILLATMTFTLHRFTK